MSKNKIQSVTFGAIESDRSPIVFLHGFPAVRSQQNREIAERLAKATGRPCLLPLYAGLGFTPGVFSFSHCLSDVRDFYQSVLAGHRGQVDLVGHSWGGFLALLLAGEEPQRIGRVALMSPLLKFHPLKACIDGFAETAKTNPQLNLGDTEKLALDFVSLGEKYPIVDLLKKISQEMPILFLQAREDSMTPAKHAQESLAQFSKKTKFELIETEHNFLSNRVLVTEKIATFLK